MPVANYVLEIDWNNNGLFTDANEDVTTDVLSVEAQRGRDFASQLTGRAVAGRLAASLRNDAGKYSPFNSASPLFGNLVPGRKVRLRTTAPSAVTLWTGFLDEILPEVVAPGRFPAARLQASGPIVKLTGKRVNPPANAGAGTGTLVGLVLDDVGWPALDRTIDAGDTTTGRWFVADKDALNAIRELEETELGFFYEGEDGKLVYESRQHRQKGDHLTSQATFSDAGGAANPYVAIEELDPLREIFNEVRAGVTPYTVGALAVLWTLADETPTLAPGESRSWFANYPNPDDITGVYVDAWTTPVVGTDITQTGVANGDIGVAVSKFANSMKITITNNHAATTATLTLIQARGTPVTKGDTKFVDAENAASQTKYGERTFRLPGPWYAETLHAQDMVGYIVGRYKDPLAILQFTIVNRTDGLLTQILTRKISELITVVATSSRTGPLGINETFFVESIRHRVTQGNTLHETTFACSPASGDAGFWILGTSALDIGTKLGV